MRPWLESIDLHFSRSRVKAILNISSNTKYTRISPDVHRVQSLCEGGSTHLLWLPLCMWFLDALRTELQFGPHLEVQCCSFVGQTDIILKFLIHLQLLPTTRSRVTTFALRLARHKQCPASVCLIYSIYPFLYILEKRLRDLFYNNKLTLTWIHISTLLYCTFLSFSFSLLFSSE